MALAELDDKNPLHASTRQKIIEFACDPTRSGFARTAERDLSITPVTTAGLREAICCHLQAGKPLLVERLDSGETAYVIKECKIESTVLYVKVKFWKPREREQMLILSAHPDRRW
jgi:hypothetical protein